MFVVINMAYDVPVFYGREEECRRRVNSLNSRAKTEMYTYTRDNDYAIAL